MLLPLATVLKLDLLKLDDILWVRQEMSNSMQSSSLKLLVWKVSSATPRSHLSTCASCTNVICCWPLLWKSSQWELSFMSCVFWALSYSHLDDKKNPFNSATNRSRQKMYKEPVKELATRFRVASESEFCLNWHIYIHKNVHIFLSVSKKLSLTPLYSFYLLSLSCYIPSSAFKIVVCMPGRQYRN